MQVITTDAVILPLKPVTGPSTAKAPPAIFLSLMIYYYFPLLLEAKQDLQNAILRSGSVVPTLQVSFCMC